MIIKKENEQIKNLIKTLNSMALIGCQVVSIVSSVAVVLTVLVVNVVVVHLFFYQRDKVSIRVEKLSIESLSSSALYGLF